MLATDVKSAHRLVKVRPDEWGMLGCAVKEDPDVVYANKVGTFGICSAAEWWSRLFGGALRLAYLVLGSGLPAELLAYADDHEGLGTGTPGRRAVACAFALVACLGYPLAAAKTRGGFRLDWLGMHVDYPSFRLGLSQARADWLAAWISTTLERGSLPLPELAAGWAAWVSPHRFWPGSAPSSAPSTPGPRRAGERRSRWSRRCGPSGRPFSGSGPRSRRA